MIAAQTVGRDACEPGGLTLTLRAGERLLINGAEIQFTDKTRIVLAKSAGHVSFLFGKQVMPASQARTPMQVLYYVIQRVYAGQHSEEKPVLLAMVKHLHGISRGETQPLLQRVLGLVAADEFHPALKIVRELIQAENANQPTCNGTVA